MIPLNWLKVESSVINQIKFIPNEKDKTGDILIEFKTGKIYKYKGVTERHAENLAHASSPNGYFRANISGNYEAEQYVEVQDGKDKRHEP